MTDRNGSVPIDDSGEQEAPPRRYPGWTEPPLPGGPSTTTPGGSWTVKSGVGIRTSSLVTTGHRIPILYGRCLITPDLPYAAPESASGVVRGRYHAVISEGPIDALEYWVGATVADFQSYVLTLGSLSITAGMPTFTLGLAAANILTKGTSPWFPKCVARGRLLFDPRLGAWGAGEYPDPAKCSYSTNPALMMADLLCFPQYGRGVDPSMVDWTSVEDAADWCDTLVSGEKRYEVNLYLQESRGADEWETTIGLHAGLRWHEDGGLWTLAYSAPVASVAATVTDDHVVEGTEPSLSFGAGAGLADRPNRFRAEWIDPDSDWTTRTVEIRAPEVDAGAAIRDAEVYRLHGFQSEAMAVRALWRIAREVWSEQELEAELTSEMIHLVEGSRITVTLASLGLSAIDFIVTRVSYDSDRVRITARRYDSTTWTDPGATSGAIPGGFFSTPGDLTSAALVSLESAVTATTPTSKTTVDYLGFSWQLPSFDYAKEVVVRVWPTGTSATWDTAGYTEYVFPPTGDTRFAASPTWKGSARSTVYQTVVRTYDTLGAEIASATTKPGFEAILRLRSLAGLMSTGVSVTESAGSSSTSTPAANEPVLMDAGFVATSGQIAVWDDAAGGVTFPAALAIVGPGASATIGGRMLIGTTVTLAADLAAAATTISVNRNTLANGDRIMLEAAPGGVAQTEFMAVTSAPSGAGPYTYSVTRNLDGSGANDWKKGDAIFNTGQTGTGFLDLYSARGLKAATEVGPAIVGNIRNSATWNDWSPRWAIGNLNGLYGYSADTYGAAFGVPTGPWLKIDATSGVRIGHNATTKVQVNASGDATFSGAITAASGTIGGWTIGSTDISSGGITLHADSTPVNNTIAIGAGAYNDTNTPFYVNGIGYFSLGDKLVFDGTDATLTIGDVVIDPSDGISMPAAGVGQSSSYGFLSGTTWIGGLYGVDSTYDAIGITCFSGSGSAIECRSTGEIVVLGWFNCDRYSTDSTDPGSGYYRATSGFKVGSLQVVGSRQAHIADPSGGSTIDSQARTAINSILSLLEAHGLMSSV